MGAGRATVRHPPRDCRQLAGVLLVAGLLITGGGRASIAQHRGTTAGSSTAPPSLEALSADECVTLVAGSHDRASLRRAAEESAAYFARGPGAHRMPFASGQVSTEDIKRSVQILLEVLTAEPALWTTHLCERLVAYRVTTPTPILLTGYYQPVLPARHQRTGRFRYPLYPPPADLVRLEREPFHPANTAALSAGRLVEGRLVPHFSRAQIDAGALADTTPALAWLDDPVEAFFLHIQGAGILQFEDGEQLHIGYAGSNGHPYRSIGALLVQQGKLSIESVTMQVLKDYLRQHPDEQDTILHTNQRYVFFRPLPTGPIGSLDVPLTERRSLAVDRSVYPSGAFAALHVPDPGTIESATNALFVFMQDAGAAITGPGRLDLFLGSGDRAGEIAGALRETADLYLFLPGNSQ